MGLLRRSPQAPAPGRDAPAPAPGNGHGQSAKPVRAPKPRKPTEEQVVQAQDVRKRYRTGEVEVEALRGVTFGVRRGELLAIMGPSGCGKTTLLNCISGLDDVSTGSVRIEGRDLAQLSDDDRTRFRAERLGFVFQSFNLLPVLSALENVMLPLLVLGNTENEARPVALASMDAVGIAHRAQHKPKELSGGEQQRCAIARSLVNDPAIIFADEPTGNLDTGTGGQILHLLQQLNKERGVTFVVVTHDAKVTDVAHRVLRMDSGLIVKVEEGGAA
ncbi:MAG: ABC transporter ATP-binding protein [Halobacteriales archaeon]|nr:ABC transporter ATP-binding protein [Halobacteriales archaeon]